MPRFALWVVSLLVLVYFAPVLVFSRYYCWGDVMLAFWPWKVFANKWLAQDVIPLWNPYVFCGLPFAANAQTALFYPLNLAGIHLPAHAALTWTVILHVWLCAIFMALYLRTIGCGPVAQCVGALAYALSGTVICRLQFITHLTSFAALPALLWIYESSRTSSGRRFLLRVALVGSLMFLGGHPNQNAVVLAALLMYAAWDGVRSARGGELPRWLSRMRYAAGGLVLAVGVSALQLLPAAELILNSSRTNWQGPAARVFALPPWQMIVWLVPDFFGNPAGSAYWGEGNYFEVSPYVGVGTLILAAAGGMASRHRVRPLLIALLIIGVLLGMGHYGPLYPLAAKLIPPLRMFRAAGRWLLLSSMAMCVLGALGWQAIEEGAVPIKVVRNATAVLTAAVALLGCGLLVATDTAGAALQPGVEAILRITHKDVPAESIQRFVGGAVVQAGASALPTLIWLLAFGVVLSLIARTHFVRQNRMVGSGSRVGSWMVVVVFGDLLWYGSGFNPTAGARLFTAHSDAPPAPGFRIATTQRFVKAGWARFVNYQQFRFEGSGDDPYAGPTVIGLPNTTMVSGIYAGTGYDPVRLKWMDQKLKSIEQRTDPEAWRELAVGTVLQNFTAAGRIDSHSVSDPLPRVEWRPRSARKSPAATEVGYEDRVNAIRFRVPAEPGTVMIRDAMYPGWAAYDNEGNRLPLTSSEGFRELELARGGKVSLVFLTQSLRVGGAITMLALAVIVFYGAVGIAKSPTGS